MSPGSGSTVMPKAASAAPCKLAARTVTLCPPTWFVVGVQTIIPFVGLMVMPAGATGRE